jgi:hypothetical protein
MLAGFLLLLTLVPGLHVYSQTPVSTPYDKVTIVRKEMVITRRGAFLKNLPIKKTATIAYPFVSGIRNRTILARVRSLLSVERVFNTTLREYRISDWLDESDYEVDYNANYILGITFWQVGSAAYVSDRSRYINIDLKTGRLIKARDVFVAEKMMELTTAVNAKLKEEVAEQIKAVKADTSFDDPSIVIKDLEEFRFEVKNLDDFSINADGVTFHYDAELPRILVAFEPAGQYLFPYTTLKPFIKPSGPLAQFVK